jgi:hypothetical protein
MSRGVKLTTQFHVVSRSRIVELYLYSPVRLHVIVRNLLSTGVTSSFFMFSVFKSGASSPTRDVATYRVRKLVQLH